MEHEPKNSAGDQNQRRDEVLQLRKRIQELEQELAESRRALSLSAKEILARQPLPYTEEELAQMVTERKGLPLEVLIADLEAADQAQ